jgi:hypothetical protein
MTLEDLMRPTDHSLQNSSMGYSRTNLGTARLTAGEGVHVQSKNRSKKNPSLEDSEECLELISNIRSAGNDCGRSNSNESGRMHYSLSGSRTKMGIGNLANVHSSGSALTSKTAVYSDDRSHNYKELSLTTDPYADNNERRTRDVMSRASSGSSNCEDRLLTIPKERNKDSQFRSSTGSSPPRSSTHKDSHLRNSTGSSPQGNCKSSTHKDSHLRSSTGSTPHGDRRSRSPKQRNDKDVTRVSGA